MQAYEPWSGQWETNMTTPSMVNMTVQAAGCTCAAWAERSGFMVPLTSADVKGCGTGADAEDGPGNRVFWTASPGPGWAIRQTSCGADATDACALARPYAFRPVDNADAIPCTLQTEGRLTIPMQTFVDAVDGGGSVGSLASYTWNMYTVQLASETSAGVGDALKQRTSAFPFIISVSPYTGIVEVMAGISTAPPLIVSVHSALNRAGGPAYVKCLADGRTVRLVWTSSAFVSARARAAKKNFHADASRHPREMCLR